MIERVIEASEQLVKHATPRRRKEAEQRLLQDLVAAGEAALAADKPDLARGLAKRAQKLAPDAAAPIVLLGRTHLARGDVKAAVREWGRSRSPAGLEQVAKLLDERPGAIDPRELLENCPLQGTILLVAREYARAGDTVRAERAARVATRDLEPTPSVAAVLAEVLELCGRPDDARAMTEAAVLRLAAPTPAAS